MSDEQPLCWYCGRRPADPAFVHHVPLKRAETKRQLVVLTSTTTKVLEVPVPRCAVCRRDNIVYTLHRMLCRAGGWIVGVVAVFCIVAALQKPPPDLPHPTLTIWLPAFLWVAVPVAILLVPFRIYIARHPRNPPHDYPPLAGLIAEGWSIGRPHRRRWPRR